jgi:hypothetical protein
MCGESAVNIQPDKAMSGKEIIEQIKALPPGERAEVAKFIVEQDDSWIPDDFKAAMNEAQELERAAKALLADYASDGKLQL